MNIPPEALKIDWAIMPTYNTIMSVAAGAGLLALVIFARDLLKFRHDRKEAVSTDGWALAFGVLGLILATTGLHMTLTWPLAAGGFPFDNIIFGETSLGFGVLLLGAAFYLWQRGEALVMAEDPIAPRGTDRAAAFDLHRRPGSEPVRNCRRRRHLPAVCRSPAGTYLRCFCRVADR